MIVVVANERSPPPCPLCGTPLQTLPPVRQAQYPGMRSACAECRTLYREEASLP